MVKHHKSARGQLWLHLPGMVREALYNTVIGAGLACADEVLEMERMALCGELRIVGAQCGDQDRFRRGGVHFAAPA